MTRVTLATANTPGAVAILELHGPGVRSVLQRLTGRERWQVRRASLCGFCSIDEGLAILIDEHRAQLMPHGGPRVVQILVEHLTTQLGCTYEPSPDPRVMYPEANSPIQADMLHAIARAASPASIDLLAAQPAVWASLLKHKGLAHDRRLEILERSDTLDKLISPPTVVVAGPANAGKSTLTNTLMGRMASIVSDLPGTTRDWVGGLVELNARGAAIAVHWIDTPGLRESDDAIEQRAIALARQQIEHADVLIAMRSSDQSWPAHAALMREPDLWVVNKVDDAGVPEVSEGLRRELPLRISAELGNNLFRLQSLVIERLGLSVLTPDLPWAFSSTLKAWCSGEPIALDYAAMAD